MDKLSKTQANHSICIPKTPGVSSSVQKNLEKRKLVRKSMLPSSISLESMKEEEAHSKDMELQLLYNDYLILNMLEHLAENNSKTLKESIVRQTAGVAMESAGDEVELNKMKIRQSDIIYLSTIQSKLDAQIEVMNDYIKNGNINNVNDIMSNLRKALKPLDVLRCNNIILPDKTDEWLELHGTLRKCNNILENIRELIDKNVEIYKGLHKGIQDFTSTYNDIAACQKKLDGVLQYLQITVLKHCSFSLQ